MFERMFELMFEPMFINCPGLLERLRSGEGVLVAEGYLFEFEARGYLKAGAFVPEIVLEHPEKVRDLHREFVHAGSDVVLAFTVSHTVIMYSRGNNSIVSFS